MHPQELVGLHHRDVLALDVNRLQMWLRPTVVNDQLLGHAGVQKKAVPLAPVAEGSYQVPVLPLLLLPHTRHYSRVVRIFLDVYRYELKHPCYTACYTEN